MMMMIKALEIFVLFLGLAQILATADIAAQEQTWSDPSSSGNDDPLTESGNNKIPAIFDFARYARNFNKNYDIKEFARKSKLFIARTLRILQHNVLYMRREVTYHLAQNEFTDLTPDELSNLYHIGQGHEFDSMVQNPDRSVGIEETGAERFSKASLEEMMMAKGDRKQTILDFSSDQESVENTRLIIDQLKGSPKLAEIMADVVNLNSFDKQRGRVEPLEANKVQRQPVVAANNANYGTHMIVSYGFLDNLRPPMENFVKRPENYSDFQSGDKIRSMPDEEQFKNIDIDELEKAIGEAIFSGLLDSMNSIFEHLSYLDPPDDDDLPKPSVINNSDKETNYYIDWRQTGCISPPKSQRTCNSCYAFAVLAMMEYFYCKQTKKSTDFSAQYIIDCGSKTQLRGCKGGKIKNVGSFIKSYGIELNTIYPYSGSEAQCPFDAQDDSNKRTGYLRPQITAWQVFNDVGAWHKWLPKSPILVGINMPADFLAYAGGVHPGLNCDPSKTHAMLLVGSGNENGLDFWLFKNSYSEFWGESGYFKLAQTAPQACFNSALVARVNFLVKSTH